MCGVVGIFAHQNVNFEIYDALTVLQHRGQDSAGMVTCDDGHFNMRRSLGYVRNVFSEHHMLRLIGNIGIGHVRYPTAGSSGVALSQPFYVNSPFGIALAHNGNLINSDALRDNLFATDKRHLNTDSDSEVIINVLAHEMQSINKLKLEAEDVFAAMEGLHKRCQGAYACVALIANHGLLGFRDPNGIRPLVLGQRIVDGKVDYMLASESAALSVIGYELLRDVAPGEAVFIDTEGQLHQRQCAQNPKLNPCIFEHVYFSRPDSMIDGIHIYKTRLRQGEKLADKILREYPEHDIDVIVPVPDTSRVASQGLAERLGLKLREGLMKNRYIGRTFIMPGQAERRKSVRQKLNTIDLEFKDKVVLLVDDSIVRGTTSKEIVEMVRAAGAKKVYLASAAPKVIYPNVYGIDMPSAKELVAYGKTEQQIAEFLDVDWLIYQDLDDLIESSREGNPEVTQFECSVFTGEYITEGVDANYLQQLEQRRNDSEKLKRHRAQFSDVDETQDTVVA